MVARAVHSWARHEAKKSASERAMQAAPDVPVGEVPALPRTRFLQKHGIMLCSLRIARTVCAIRGWMHATVGAACGVPTCC